MLVFELLTDMALTFEDIFVLLSLLASLLLLGWRSMAFRPPWGRLVAENLLKLSLGAWAVATVRALMTDTPQMTTDQYNFCRAVEAMKLDLLRAGKETAWLVAHPGLHTLTHGQALTWGEVDGQDCGLKVLESQACRPESFYLTYRRPHGAGSEHG